MRDARFSAVAAAALAAVVAAEACSFPEVSFSDVIGTASATGSGVTSTGAQGGGSGSGGAGGAGGASGASGSSASSATGSAGGGGQGGAGPGSGGGGQGGTDCTDADGDNDGHDAIACMGNDCDDGNVDVFPGQTEYSAVKLPNGTFDYNCDGESTPEFESVSCMGIACMAKTNVFLEDAACGMPGVFGDCTGLCKLQNVTTKTVECR